MAQFNAFEEAIDFSFWREVCEEHGTPRSYRRGECFIRAGEIMRNVGWIVSGGFKHCLTDSEGNEKAVGFVFSGSVIANYISSVLGKPIPTDIVALEDSEVLVVPAEYIRSRFASDPSLHLHFVQVLFEQAYALILNDYRSTPQQRYRQLCRRYPRILSLVSLGEIASYLNISRRQLHRIRLAENDDDAS